MADDDKHRNIAETVVDRASIGWGIHHGHYKALVEAVAKALADAEQRGVDSIAASQPRQGGADGREAIKVFEVQYGPGPDGPWHETTHACAHKDSEFSDWGEAKVATTGPEGPSEWRRQRVVPYVPAESRQQQESGWVLCSERMPEPFALVQFAAKGVAGPTLGKFNGHRWMALFDLSKPGLVDYGQGQVTHWAPLLPPPPAERPAKEPSDD